MADETMERERVELIFEEAIRLYMIAIEGVWIRKVVRVRFYVK